MVDAAEGAAAKQGPAANLAVGTETLSGQDAVTFTKYVRLVLPLDGFVFWVKADLVSPSAIFNTSALNKFKFGQPQVVTAAAAAIQVQGSFHYSTKQDQGEDAVMGVSSVIFTALAPVQQFNELQPGQMWIGTYPGDDENYDGPVSFAFSERGNYYKEADLFHYRGTAVLPVFQANLIDSLQALSQRQLIISDSLPLFLAMNNYVPPYFDGFRNNLPLFPSFLIPDNLKPPYGAVHVLPDQTEALQSAPAFGPTLSEAQLCRDRVRITLWGLTNDAALSFRSFLVQYSYDLNTFGLMNMPAVRDEHRTQSELNVLGMKKVIDLEVSYNQETVRNVARNYISKVINNYEPILPPAPPTAALDYF